MDFLLHEMPVFSLLSGGSIPGNGMQVRCDRSPFECFHLHLVASDDSHLVGFEENDPAGMVQDGGDIGGNEILSLAKADNNAAGIADTGADNLVGLVSTHEHDAVSALD